MIKANSLLCSFSQKKTVKVVADHVHGKGRHKSTWTQGRRRVMSYCKREGKDVSVFVTEEDIDNPETVTTLAVDEQYGIVLPSGELNWDCPCLGGMAYGPCGQEFKDAFSCFHYSEAEEKGSDCIPQFRTMQECFEKHPEVYGKYADDDNGGDGGSEGTERQEEGGKGDGGDVETEPVNNGVDEKTEKENKSEVSSTAVTNAS